VQARAEKLESALAEKESALESLRAELAAERGAKEHAGTLSSERDELRVQMAYFQKQIGSLQRTIKEKEKALEQALSPLRREVTAISRPPKELLAAAGGATTASTPAAGEDPSPVTAPAVEPVKERGTVTEPEIPALKLTEPLAAKKGTGTGVRASLSKAARPAPSRVDLPNEWAEQVAPEPKTVPSGPPVATPRPKR
jgi:hypothetical protein